MEKTSSSGHPPANSFPSTSLWFTHPVCRKLSFMTASLFPCVSGCFSPYIPSLFSSSHITHPSGLCSPLLIFDCSVTTCPHLPETLGQGASEMQLVKIHLSLHSGSESMCGSLMPAVSSHYLIGIEMHLACVFVSTALLVEIPSLIPSPSLLDSYSCRLAERCFLSPVVWSNSLLHG